MTRSTVEISMQEDNNLSCSYALIKKGAVQIIIILKDNECAIFNYPQLKRTTLKNNYLLLKHYPNPFYAYTDFLKLIGKMCKKHDDSKYFLNPINEDNRIIYDSIVNEHMISDEEKNIYEDRYVSFLNFVFDNSNKF